MEEKLIGGYGDGKTISDLVKKYSKYGFNKSFLKKQLNMGIKVEFEHTYDPDIAKEIAMDHLAEIPDYYTRLKNMEDTAIEEIGLKENNENQEGFKQYLIS